jgi:mono/diheme cytochrome c family protein
MLLSSSPNVHACITKKVWEFVQGTGVRLDPEFGAELVDVYKQTDSLRSVVAAAVRHPYFWSTERPPPMNFADVKREFDTCATCHAKGGPTKPDFDPKSYPFAATATENVAFLRRIFGAINRDAGFKAMPPQDAAALSPEALALIRQWIAAGAHDNKNQPSLNDDEIKEVLGE